jgi:hypothetical protein
MTEMFNPTTFFEYIDFNLTPTVTHQEGRFHWDADNGTIAIGFPGGNVELQVGQEGLVRVRNESGSTIANGKVVYTTGASGQKPLIDLADNTDADKIHILGMATEEIAHNANGYVTLWGNVNGDTAQPIDTSSYAPGTHLYLSTAGGWTDTHPTDATHAVIEIGTVLNQHASEGRIMYHTHEHTIGNNSDLTMRQSIINKSTGTSAASGFTAVNDAGHWATMGIGGSNNTAFPDVAVFYGPGYNDNWYAVDGNKDHVFYTDPTDSHNNSSLSYPRFYIEADGTLSVGATDYETLVTADDDIPNKKYTDDAIDTDIATHVGTSQAHSDYLINDGNDATTGELTAKKFITNNTTVGTYTQNSHTTNITNSGIDFSTIYTNTHIDMDYTHAGTFSSIDLIGLDIDIDLSGAIAGGAHRLIDADIDYAAVASNSTPAVDIAGTGTGASNFSEGFTRVALTTSYNAAGANEAIAFKSTSSTSGSATAIGYRGWAAGTGSASGTLIGVEGYTVPVSTNACVVAMQGNPEPAGTIANDKRMTFRGVSGHILNYGGSILCMDTGNNSPNDYSPTHLDFLNNGGELWVEGESEFDGTIFADNATTAINAAGPMVLPKTTGVGIKVDNASPTYGWRDLLGDIKTRPAAGGGAAAQPDYVAYRSPIYAYRFGTNAPNNHNHECFLEFHIPHDYVPGSDLYIHVHWSQIVVDTGGAAGVPGDAKWYWDATYASGYDADAFSAPITTSIVDQASTTQYNHMISEIQLSATSPSASQLDSDDIEVDGLLLVRLYRDPTDGADTLDQDTFVHYVDIHYQSTNMATKDRNTPFYT